MLIMLLPASLVPVFRLIDVKQMNLVELHNADLSRLRYAALSYVWGGPQRLMLGKENLSDLKKAGFLLGRVANTVQDAMQFASLIRIPYLWVDALCILQDVDEDKTLQIANLSRVYINSHLTIIAASGKNSDAGLPGITAFRSATQHEVFLPGHQNGEIPMGLLSMLSPRPNHYAHYSDGCLWSTRGWTFQERVLSRRAIFFFDEQIFWACFKAQRSEETHFETPLAGLRLRQLEVVPQTLLQIGSLSELDVWGLYIDMVWQYSMRSLTHPGDAYDAFAAIMQQTQEMMGPGCLLWGIRTARFESELSWTHWTVPRRRTCLTTLPMTASDQRVPFPSWSWLGVRIIHCSSMLLR